MLLAYLMLFAALSNALVHNAVCNACLLNVVCCSI